MDIDRTRIVRAYPQAPTLEVEAEASAVVDAILARAERLARRVPPMRRTSAPRLTRIPADDRPIHPATVMAAIQRVAVDATDIAVLADAASSMCWGARYLVFDEPCRWWVENAWGAVGSAAAAVLGTALGRGGAALAIVGDGAMQTQD